MRNAVHFENALKSLIDDTDAFLKANNEVFNMRDPKAQILNNRCRAIALAYQTTPEEVGAIVGTECKIRRMSPQQLREIFTFH